MPSRNVLEKKMTANIPGLDSEPGRTDLSARLRRHIVRDSVKNDALVREAADALDDLNELLAETSNASDKPPVGLTDRLMLDLIDMNDDAVVAKFAKKVLPEMISELAELRSKA